jgi:hypothetical protein
MQRQVEAREARVNDVSGLAEEEIRTVEGKE